MHQGRGHNAGALRKVRAEFTIEDHKMFVSFLKPFDCDVILLFQVSPGIGLREKRGLDHRAKRGKSMRVVWSVSSED